MSEEHPNSSLIRDFHDHQNRFYAGGEQGPARAMLAEDAAWHVPGRSAIAGDYRGREEVWSGRDETLGYDHHQSRQDHGIGASAINR